MYRPEALDQYQSLSGISTSVTDVDSSSRQRTSQPTPAEGGNFDPWSALRASDPTVRRGEAAKGGGMVAELRDVFGRGAPAADLTAGSLGCWAE
jgi:hypothetical protein